VARENEQEGHESRQQISARFWGVRETQHGSSASQRTVTVASNEPDRVLVAAGSLDQDRRPGFSGLGKEAREEFSVVVRFESASTPFKAGAKLAVFGIQAT
jgi:hypothetical protein